MKVATIFVTLALSALVGCSSQPRSGAGETRASYIVDAEKRLDRWQDRIGDLRADRQPAPRAALNDARAELRLLRAAPDTAWSEYRGRVDSRITHIQSVYDSMKSE